MGTIIVVAILIIILVLALRSSITHLTGQGGCCGGGGELKAEKKRLSGPIVARRQIVIEGMHCENCKNRVELCLNQLDGVFAKVNLKKQTATVSMNRLVADSQLRLCVENAGYTVVRIEEL